MDGDGRGAAVAETYSPSAKRRDDLIFAAMGLASLPFAVSARFSDWWGLLPWYALCWVAARLAARLHERRGGSITDPALRVFSASLVLLVCGVWSYGGLFAAEPPNVAPFGGFLGLLVLPWLWSVGRRIRRRRGCQRVGQVATAALVVAVLALVYVAFVGR